MFGLYGINQLKQLRNAGVFSETEVTPGVLVSRQVLDIGDTLSELAFLNNAGVGGHSIQTTPLPAGYIYAIRAINLWWLTGTVTVCKLNVQTTYTHQLASSNNLTINTTLGWSGLMYLQPGNYIEGVFTVTVAGPELFVGVIYDRTPNPQ